MEKEIEQPESTSKETDKDKPKSFSFNGTNYEVIIIEEEDPFIYKQEQIMFAKIWEIICWPYNEYKFRKKMKQLRKKDPYIYK